MQTKKNGNIEEEKQTRNPTQYVLKTTMRKKHK
jgi:hypothetical protein